jgi:hypothetical protein
MSYSGERSEEIMKLVTQLMSIVKTQQGNHYQKEKMRAKMEKMREDNEFSGSYHDFSNEIQKLGTASSNYLAFNVQRDRIDLYESEHFVLYLMIRGDNDLINVIRAAVTPTHADNFDPSSPRLYYTIDSKEQTIFKRLLRVMGEREFRTQLIKTRSKYLARTAFDTLSSGASATSSMMGNAKSRIVDGIHEQTCRNLKAKLNATDPNDKTAIDEVMSQMMREKCSNLRRSTSFKRHSNDM